MDDLLEHLRSEIAMDGDDGTPAERLDGFLTAYYEQQQTRCANQPSTSIIQQNVDDRFREFVWRQLVALPEITVAYLRKVENGNTVDNGSPAIGTLHDDESKAGTPPMLDSTAETKAKEKGKGRARPSLKAAKEELRAGMGDNKQRARDARLNAEEYTFCKLDHAEVHSSTRQQLVERYGQSALRIAADPETCYIALTGSHEKHGKLTHLCYQILQAIARGREKGKTVVELGYEFSHDQKSLFHFAKNLLELNLIVKFRVLDARLQTSRCIHRHYLETSSYWATRQVKDPDTVPNAGVADVDDDEDDVSKPLQLSFLTVAHLNSNEPLIRARVVLALKNAQDNIIPHTEMLAAIGFKYQPERLDRRRFNRIITSMCEKGLVEKVGVARKGARGLQSCLKLPDEGDARAIKIEGVLEEEVQRPNLILTTPVERQILDYLVEAGPLGAAIKEIRVGIGDINHRIIETILARFERSPQPPHLCDVQVMSVMETEGRQKQLRYFTLTGYKARCIQDGVDAPDFQVCPYPDLAGGFSLGESAGHYETPASLEIYINNLNTNVSTRMSRIAKKGAQSATRKGSEEAGVPDVKRRKKAMDDTPIADQLPKRKGRPPGSRKANKVQEMLNEYVAKGEEPPKELLEEFERAKKLKYRCRAKQLTEEERNALTGLVEVDEPVTGKAGTRKRKRKTAELDAAKDVEAVTTAADAGIKVAPASDSIVDDAPATKRRKSRAGKKAAPATTLTASPADSEVISSEPVSQPPPLVPVIVNAQPQPPAQQPDAGDPPVIRRGRPRKYPEGMSKADRAKMAREAKKAAKGQITAGASSDTPIVDDASLAVAHGNVEEHITDRVAGVLTVPEILTAPETSAIPPDNYTELLEDAIDIPNNPSGLPNASEMAETGPSASQDEIQDAINQLLARTNEPQQDAANDEPDDRPPARMLNGTAEDHPGMRTVPDVPEMRNALASPEAENNGTDSMAVDDVPVTAVSESTRQQASRLPSTNRSLSAIASATPAVTPSSRIFPKIPIKRVAKASKIVDRVNHSLLRHERDFTDLLKDRGGIIEEAFLTKLWEEWKMERIPPGEVLHKIDKRTERLVLNSLEQRNVIKRTSIQILGSNDKLINKSIVYLTTIEIGDPQMQEWVKALQDTIMRTGNRPLFPNRKQLELLEDGSLVPALDGIAVPEIDNADPRSIFATDWRIAAQTTGWCPGMYARARALHIHLVSSITDDNDSSYIVSSNQDTRILASGYFMADLPLSVFLSICATVELNDVLLAYLDNNDASQVLVKDAPPHVQAILEPGSQRNGHRIQRLLEILFKLSLVKPMAQVDTATDTVIYSGVQREPRYFETHVKTNSSYWMLLNSAPLYAYNERVKSKQILLGEMPTVTSADTEVFWTTLQAICLRKPYDTFLLPAQAAHPLLPTTTKTFARTIGTALRWKQSTLYQNQKTYLRRVLQARRDNGQSIIDHPEELQKLTYDLCARDEDITKAFIANYIKNVSTDRLQSKMRFRRRKAQQPAKSEGESEDSSEVGEAEPGSRSHRGQAGRRKNKEDLEDKQQIWHAAIQQAFEKHGEANFDRQHLQYLYTWFCSPDGLSASELMKQLETMVEDSVTLSLGGPSGLVFDPTVSAARSRSVAALLQEPSQSTRLAQYDAEDPPPALAPVLLVAGVKKTPTLGWEEAEDDQLRDFYVILHARAVHLGSSNTVDVQPMLPYYPGCDKKLLLSRLRRRVTAHEEGPYLDALGHAWNDIWLERRGCKYLPEPHPSHPTEVDLLAHRTYLCAKINKQTVRFKAMMPKNQMETFVQLPGTRAALENSFNIDRQTTLDQRDAPARWDYLWSTITVAQKLNQYNARPLTRPLSEVDIYKVDENTTSAKRVEMFAQRCPYATALPAQMQTEAAAYERRLTTDKEIEWISLANDGDVLALCELFSRDLLNFTLDTSTTLEGRPYTDYRTRKIDDDSFENALTVSLQPKYYEQGETIFRLEEPAQAMLSSEDVPVEQ